MKRCFKFIERGIRVYYRESYTCYNYSNNIPIVALCPVTYSLCVQCLRVTTILHTYCIHVFCLIECVFPRKRQARFGGICSGDTMTAVINLPLPNPLIMVTTTPLPNLTSLLPLTLWPCHTLLFEVLSLSLPSPSQPLPSLTYVITMQLVALGASGDILFDMQRHLRDYGLLFTYGMSGRDSIHVKCALGEYIWLIKLVDKTFSTLVLRLVI